MNASPSEWRGSGSLLAGQLRYTSDGAILSRRGGSAVDGPPSMESVLAIAQRHGIELLGPIPVDQSLTIDGAHFRGEIVARPLVEIDRPQVPQRWWLVRNRW